MSKRLTQRRPVVGSDPENRMHLVSIPWVETSGRSGCPYGHNNWTHAVLWSVLTAMGMDTTKDALQWLKEAERQLLGAIRSLENPKARIVPEPAQETVFLGERDRQDFARDTMLLDHLQQLLRHTDAELRFNDDPDVEEAPHIGGMMPVGFSLAMSGCTGAAVTVGDNLREVLEQDLACNSEARV